MNISVNQIMKKARPNKEISSLRYIDSEFIRDPIAWFTKFSPTLRYILNVLLETDNNVRNATLLHSTIARRAGCSVATVKVYLNILEKAGLISRIGRYYRSSIFRVSNYFHNPGNRARLSSLFKAFCWLPLMFLAICNGQWIKRYDIFQTSNQLLEVSNIYKKYNSKFFIGTKDNQLSDKRTRNAAMNIKDYPNMQKRHESDNNFIRKAHMGSQKLYSDGKRPQCEGGSVKSELSRRREQDSALEQQLRMLVAETKKVAPVDFIKELLSKQSWML